MNLGLIAMLIPVALVVAVMKFYYHATITHRETAFQFGVAFLIVFGTYQIGLKSRMHDRQFLNGVVTGKERDTVSCSHSYSCNCSTDSKGNRSCQTCYEHWADYDWNVHTNAGNTTFTIEREDRQGKYEPARWTAVAIGEPVALEANFDNYVLAAPDSIFHRMPGTRKMPAYPEGFDYSRANRVITDGVKVPDIAQWNADLTEILGQIGPKKQANIVIVFTSDPSPDYAESLRNSWLGGKKNDTVVVIGTPRYPEIAWASVFSWSKNEMLNVALRNDIRELKTVNRPAVLGTIRSNVSEHFVRRPMAEYAYLKDEIEPTPFFLIVGWILAVCAPIGLGLFFHRHDTFGEGSAWDYRPRSEGNFYRRRFR